MPAVARNEERHDHDLGRPALHEPGHHVLERPRLGLGPHQERDLDRAARLGQARDVAHAVVPLGFGSVRDDDRRRPVMGGLRGECRGAQDHAEERERGPHRALRSPKPASNDKTRFRPGASAAP